MNKSFRVFKTKVIKDKILKTFLSFIIIANSLYFSYGNSTNINPSFRNYKIEDGISQSSVFAIVQDQDGFIWLGTRDGLNRFDARRFSVYRTIRGDSTSLSSNEINCLETDQSGNLWIGTRKGLHIYNKEFDNFIRIKLSSSESDHSPQESIRGILADSKGNLWVLSGTRVFVSNPANQFTFHQIDIAESNKEIRKSLMINVFEDSRGTIWISNNTQLFSVEYNFSANFHYQAKLFHFQNINENMRVNDILEYPKGKLWMSTEQDGIVLHDILTNTQKQYLAESANQSSLIGNKVRAATTDENGKIWFGTSDGISILDPITDKFTNIQNDPHNPLSISANSVVSMYKDHSETIWIGTFYGGVNLYNKNHFNYTYYKQNGNNTGLNTKIVSDIVEDKKHNLWIGTEGGGLNYLNRSNNTFTYYTTKSKGTRLTHNNIKCLFISKDEQLWLGTSGGGVNIIDLNTYQVDILQNEKDNQNSIASDWIYAIIDDRKGSIWIGTYGHGLDRLNKNTDEITHYNKNDGPFSISSNSIRFMLVDSKDQLWIGTSRGLCLYNESTNNFKHYFAVEYDSTTLLSDDIYCIHEDINGQIWVGSYDGGLNLLNNAGETFTRYSVRDGLPGHTVYGILEDEMGFLWISTNNGITRFDPKNEQFRNFDSKDGLPGDEYNYNSFFKSSYGELFFGGKNGLISFHPNQISTNPYKPNVVFTDLLLYNKPVEIGDESGILSKHINKTSKIRLKHYQDIVTFEFSCLNFINPLKNKLAYRLTGLNDEWQYTQLQQATFMNLPPGNYKLQVKGSNNDGIWSDKFAELEINVLPPPWKTLWAYFIYFAIFLGALFGLIHFQKSRTNLRHKYELNQIQMERQKELHQLKLKYFTNISHEIRTPLTLLITPLENLLKIYKNDLFLYNKLIGLRNNAERLLRLVNQLMDFRKQETGNLELREAEGDIIKFITEISLAFQEEANRRNIDFKFIPKESSVSLWYDRNELEKVFFNLLSNAFKFAEEGGYIFVKTQIINEQKSENKNPRFKIKIENSGKGISPEKLPLIFDRYYQIEKQGLTEYGSGIGLALSKGIIELHKGMISVDSRLKTEKEQGCTCFTIVLPMGNDHIHQKNIIPFFKNSESIELYNLMDEEEVEATYERGRDFEATILVIEDNDEIRELICKELQTHYSVREARDGEEGWQIAIEIIPDLIISDVVMPKMDGLEFCRRIKSDERTNHIPVILLTARISLIHRASGLKSGADEYITKPFNIKILLLRIHNLIMNRKKLREKYSSSFNLAPQQINEESSPDDIFLNNTAEIIQKELMNPQFSVIKLAEEVGMSQSVLYRKIKAITDLSPNELIKKIKLNLASQILISEDVTISEVGFRVGFNDSKYFSQAFKKQFGLTPSEFKRKKNK